MSTDQGRYGGGVLNESAITLAHSLRADPYPNPDYQVIRHPSDITAYIGEEYYAGGSRDTDCLILAEDTESLPDGSPYCLTFSIRPGTGRLIYARDRELLADYSLNVIKSLDPHHIFHNYLHDCVPFSALSLPIHKFTDTMVRAYHLCLGGGGDDEDSESKAGRGSLSLKVLAYRHLNMKMTSFKDTVYPYSVPHLAKWLETAATALAPLPKVKMCVCGHETGFHEKRGKNQKNIGECLLCSCTRHKAGKPLPPTAEDKSYASLFTKSSRLSKRLIEETDTDWADSKKDPWKFIRTNWQEDIATLETVAGPIPVPSVAFVPEPQLLNYACRDADATLRLFFFMRHLKPWLFYP
jgi:hypothetical protein